MTFTYVRVALVLWRSGSMNENDEAAASVPRAQMKLRRKKAKMLIVVVLMFGVCYLPVYMLFIFQVTGVLLYFPMSSIPPLAMLAHWLCYFNSSINPAIYNFMSCNFRREFRVACYICCRRGSERGMTMYEALRLRNISRLQQAARALQQNETSGLTRTESTMLATPVLNGRRAVGEGGEAPRGERNRHLFITLPTPQFVITRETSRQTAAATVDPRLIRFPLLSCPPPRQLPFQNKGRLTALTGARSRSPEIGVPGQHQTHPSEHSAQCECPDGGAASGDGLQDEGHHGDAVGDTDIGREWLADKKIPR
ncbi:neuropeptide FF receptor 1-like [Pomacea canaliculata]|uniref:neuropeptide FF receptor 1-like n=1 Tax=Pomacea canaliculata TaxID=400727 RepID=UPI000D73D8BD|nr:neuropeptide FF receptor 1-like [Pomacea canaliculata]